MSVSPDFIAFSSGRHRIAAHEFLRRAREMEQGLASDDAIDFLSEEMTLYHAYVTGVISSTWAYLEATINEFWWTVSHPLNRFHYVRGPSTLSLRDEPGLTEHEAEILSAVSPHVLSARKGLTWKYDQARIAIGREEPSEGREPKVGVEKLTAFRNRFLIHILPVETSGDQPDAVQKMLGSYFKPEMTNPLAGEGAPFFPTRCLSESLGRRFLFDGESYTKAFFRAMGLGDFRHLGNLGIRTVTAEFRPRSASQ